MKINSKNYRTIWFENNIVKIIDQTKLPHQFVIKVLLSNAEKAKSMIKNLIDNFENHIDPKDPANNCLDVAIITAPEKRTQKTKDKLKTVAGRVLNK